MGSDFKLKGSDINSPNIFGAEVERENMTKQAVRNLGIIHHGITVREAWEKFQPELQRLKQEYQERWKGFRRNVLWRALKADLENYGLENPYTYGRMTKQSIIDARVEQRARHQATELWGDGSHEVFEEGKPLKMSPKLPLEENETRVAKDKHVINIEYDAQAHRHGNEHAKLRVTGWVTVESYLPRSAWENPTPAQKADIGKFLKEAIEMGTGGNEYGLLVETESPGIVEHLDYRLITPLDQHDEFKYLDIAKVSLFASNHPTTYRAIRGDRGIEDVCVIDTLLTHYRGQPGFAKLVRSDLEYLYGETKHSPEGHCCLLDVYDWLHERKLKYKIVDCCYRTISSSSYKQHSNVKMLYAMVANNHLYLLPGAEALESSLPQLDLRNAVALENASLEDIDKFESNSVVVIKQDNVLPLISELWKRNTIASDIDSSYTRMMANGVHVVARPDWDDCKAIVAALAGSPMAPMVQTATIGGIANTMLTQAGVPQSTLNNDVAMLLGRVPILMHDYEAEADGDIMCVDCVRSHPSILRDITDALVLDASSTPKPLSADASIDDYAYYVARSQSSALSGGGFRFMEVNLGAQLVCRGEQMRTLMDMGIVERSDIKYVIQAYAHAPVDFKGVFDMIDGLDIPPKTAKHLRVAVCGSLRSTRTKPRAFLTNNWRMVVCRKDEERMAAIDDKTSLESLGDGLYAVKCGESKRVTRSRSPLYTDILMGQMIKTLKLRQALGGYLVQLKTDSVTVVGCKSALDSIDIREGYGGYRVEQYKHQRLKSHPITDIYKPRKWRDVDLETVCTEGGLVCAHAGRGKTYGCLKLLSSKRGICTAYSHTVVRTMRQMHEGFDGCGETQFHTVAALLAMYETNPSSFTRLLMSVSYLFVDEVFCVSNQDMRRLYEIARSGLCTLVMAGDPDQLESCDDHPVRWYETVALKEMAGYRHCRLTKLQRYDEELDEVCQTILAGKDVRRRFRPTTEASQHLCWTHKKRIALNAREMIKHKPDDAVLLKAPNTESPCPHQDVWLYTGLPVYACVNQKKHGIYNRMSGSVTRVGHSDEASSEHDMTIRCGDREFTMKHSEFHAVWRCGYARTIHSSQGATLIGAVGFHEQDRWDRRMAYTMLSRVKSVHDICMDGPLTARSEREHADVCPVVSDWRYVGIVDDNVEVSETPSARLLLKVEAEDVERWTRVLGARAAPEQKPVLEGGEHDVKLLGTIMWEDSRNRWVWRAMINGKRSRKTVAVTSKRSKDEALVLIKEHQLKFSR